MAVMQASETLLQNLRAAVGDDAAARKRATQYLQMSAGESGTSASLVQIGLAAQVELGVRQLALLMLRQHIRAHWTPEAPGFREPMIEEGEKAVVRSQLPAGLADPSSKLRTAVGLAVAAIAKWDCPDAWPSLLDDLMRAIEQQGDQHLVHGALQCLSLIASELTDDEVIQAAPFLFSQLLRVVQGADAAAAAVVQHALSIVHSLLSVLISLVGSHRTEVRSLVQSTLPAWCQQLGRLLSVPLQPQPGFTRALWGGQLEALKVLTQLAAHFGKDIAAQLPALCAHVWQLFSGSLPLYEAAAVRGEEEALPGAAEDGEEAPSLDNVLGQALELLLVLAEAKRFRPLLEPSLPQLMHLCIGYMQMTEEQIAAWEDDVNMMISDEDFQAGEAVRPTCEALVQALVVNAGRPACSALAEAVQSRLAQAASQKAAGSDSWWRLKEAALLAAGDAQAVLAEESDTGDQLVALNATALLDHLLSEELGSAAASAAVPFLVGRALSFGAQCSEYLNPQQATQLLTAAAAALASTSAPIQVGALRTVLAVVEELKADALRPHLPALYNGLGSLLRSATEEHLNLVLEALESLVEADPEAAAASEHAISPGALAVWEANVTDPLVSVAALELLEALAKIPSCLASLQERVLPPLAGILANPDNQPDMLVEGALDLLATLLRAGGPQGAAKVHAAASAHVLSLLQSSDDSGVLVNCCEYWRCLLRVGGTPVIVAGGADPNAAAAAIASALARPLQPQLDDAAAMAVGPALLALLAAAPSAVAPTIPSLLGAVTGKLAVAQSSPVIAGLLLVVARLVHLHLPDTLACLASLPDPSGSQRSALEMVMSVWVDRCMEFRGQFQIKLAAIAAAQLMCADNSTLDSIQVKGRRMDTSGGPRTRSQARAQPEQWDSVPLRLKLFLLTVDALAEAQAQGPGGGGEAQESDDDWVTDSESGEEDDAVQKASKPSLEALLAKAAADEESDDGLEDADFRNDPLANTNLLEALAERLRAFAASDANRFQAAFNYLTQPQQDALQRLG